jgi:hypothetical protein
MDLYEGWSQEYCPRCTQNRCYMIKKEINNKVYFVCPQCRLKIEDLCEGDGIVVSLWKTNYEERLKKK